MASKIKNILSMSDNMPVLRDLRFSAYLWTCTLTGINRGLASIPRPTPLWFLTTGNEIPPLKMAFYIRIIFATGEQVYRNDGHAKVGRYANSNYSA